MIKKINGAYLTADEAGSAEFNLDDIYNTFQFKLPKEGEGKTTSVKNGYTKTVYQIKGGCIVEKTYPNSHYTLSLS